MTSTVDIDARAMKDISDFAAKHGMSADEYVEALAIEAVDDNYVPASKLKPTDRLIKDMEQAESDLKAGRAAGPFNKDQALEHLRSLIK